MEAAQLLLECLRDQIHASAYDIGDPTICLRFGEVVNPSLGTITDECCTGLAWVRVVSVEPQRQRDEPGALPCVSSERLVTLEMGTARCIPTGDVQRPTSCDAWTEAALKMDSDQGAMEAALCCLSDMLRDVPESYLVYPGTYLPGGPDGNCITGRMEVVVGIDCGCASAAA